MLPSTTYTVPLGSARSRKQLGVHAASDARAAAGSSTYSAAASAQRQRGGSFEVSQASGMHTGHDDSWRAAEMGWEGGREGGREGGIESRKGWDRERAELMTNFSRIAYCAETEILDWTCAVCSYGLVV
jgi:hypothetical protein